MKKVLSIFGVASIALFPLLAFALTEPGQEVTNPPSVIQSIGDLLSLLSTIARWMLSILLIVAVIFIIWAGFDFVTAGGDPGKVAGARQKLLYAAVGIIVGVAAWGIVKVVQTLVGA